MASDDRSNFRWWVGIIVALMAAGGGLAGWRALFSNGADQTPPQGPPTIREFATVPPRVAGGALQLAWQVDGASTVVITPAVGEVAVSGRVEVRPESSTVYTLTASNAGGQSTATTRVDVRPAAPIRLGATPYPPTVSPGQTVTIHVTVEDETGMPLSGARVTVRTGGGRFLDSAAAVVDAADLLHGPFQVNGVTGDDGRFTAWWVCRPCAPGGYGITVEARKEGHHEATTDIGVKTSQ